nr:hypothetical protein [Candidatus Dependentiae bacterium]
ECIQAHILSVPTLCWTNIQEMSAVLSDKDKLKKHKKAVLELVLTHELDGININYERVDSKDKEAFTTFLEDLSKELHRNKKVLHLTLEARTSDYTVVALYDTTYLRPRMLLNAGNTWVTRRYKKVVAECCDQVHIMGYDEFGSPYASNRNHLDNEYYVSHSSNRWIEQIITHALSYIPRHKIVLGVPVYGYEFVITPTDYGITFKKKRSLYYRAATELCLLMQKKPVRTAGGELSFTYKTGDENRYVCYMSAETIQEKIALAKKYRIKGINIFCINGNEDPALWNVLEKELISSSFK